MKKMLILLAGLAIIAMVVVTVGAACYTERSAVARLSEEKSYLNRWYIEDDAVYYDCHLVFYSEGREDVSFQICAFSEKDFQANLISTAYLHCDSGLHIPAGTTEYGVDVLLYAPRGHANTKPDRLLPETIIPHSISISKTD